MWFLKYITFSPVLFLTNLYFRKRRSWHLVPPLQEIDGETVETVSDFIFLGSKITADGDCSHEIKRCLLLGRKAVINLLLLSHFSRVRPSATPWIAACQASLSTTNSRSSLSLTSIESIHVHWESRTLTSLLQHHSSKHQFFGSQLSSQSNSHIHTWPLEKP